MQPLPLEIVGSWREQWVPCVLTGNSYTLEVGHVGGTRPLAVPLSLPPLASKRLYLNQLDRKLCPSFCLLQQEHSKMRLSLESPPIPLRTHSNVGCKSHVPVESGWMCSPISKLYSAASCYSA